VKFSLAWLREYAPLDAPSDRLARILVDTGTEVNSVQRIADGAIVARIKSLEKVAEARKSITIATLDVGAGEPVVVLTAATNLSIGDRVAWAPPGVTPAGWEEPLGVREMFGRESPGMLLAEDELGLGQGHEGIMVLDHGVPGQPIHEVLPVDSVLDVEVTTNRPDCLCHVGIARELAAALAEPLREPDSSIAEGLQSATAVDRRLAVRIEDPQGCPRFTARIIENVRVGPSPEWMQRRLRAIGQRPINNVVDVTNYVAAELCQPMHAFDLDRFRQESPDLHNGDPTLVVVRRARAGEVVDGLDGHPYTLGPDDLAVCTGDTTAVTGTTRHVLLEAANWDPLRIRATSRRLGIRTDASSRFEKGLSDTIAPPALDRAAALIAELGDGHVLRGAIDEHPAPLPPIGEITVPNDLVESVLGTRIDPAEAATSLARLGFAVVQEPGGLLVTPPHFRRDVRIPVDVIEEIGRSVGYGRVPATLPGRRQEVRGIAAPAPVEDAVRDILCGAGFDEAITWSFVSPQAAARLHGAGGPRAPIPLRNPLNEEWSVMRTSVLPGLCAAVALNQRRGVHGAALFELGRGFWEGARQGQPEGATPDGADDALPPLPAEPLLLGLVSQADDTSGEAAAASLRRLQAVIGWLGNEFRGREVEIVPVDVPGLRPGRSGEVHVDGRRVGVLGELMPAVLQGFELRGRVNVAEVRLDELVPATSALPRFVAPPRMPAVEQDLAVVVDAGARAGDALRAARKAGGELLESITLLDTYRNERLGAGRKSWTFHLVMRAADRTLTGAEAQAVQTAVEAALRAEFGAEVRR
jgi:phenylalanyl-tRNA synthetase beta chain